MTNTDTTKELHLICPQRAAEIEALAAKAKAYWDANATFTKGGYSSLPADLAKHPDYTGCPNELRGQLEQFNFASNKNIENYSAYVSMADGNSNSELKVGQSVILTVWTGLPIAMTARVNSAWWANGTRMYAGQCRAINGRAYAWRGQGAGMYCSMKALKV
jgi:hypothetical protein